VAGSCEHGNEPSGCIKYGELLVADRTLSFSIRTLLHAVGTTNSTIRSITPTRKLVLSYCSYAIYSSSPRVGQIQN
jgi:hypothetical protein